jgi:hypothetical protein
VKTHSKRKSYREYAPHQKDAANRGSYKWKYTTPGGLLTRIRLQSKRRGIEFALTKDDIPPLPDQCPLLLVPFGEHKTEYAPTIDRIDSNVGYVPGNVHYVSHRGNTLKNCATLEEMVLLGRWAEQQLAHKTSGETQPLT